ncbi:MAG: hypothetical protein AAF492_16160, partial [Verrucomicrobiota bacterium]
MAFGLNAPAASTDVAVIAAEDDAEESADGTTVALFDTRLELVDAGAAIGLQKVGIRWASVNVPRNVGISDAWIQFTAHGSFGGTVNLELRGEDADNPLTYQAAPFNISSRPTTTAMVPWSPPTWFHNGAGAAQRSPNLAPLFQEIIDRPGWNPGQAMAIVITSTDAARRGARSFPSGPAMLHIEWTGLRIENDAGAVITGPDSADLNGELTELGVGIPTVTVYWGTTDGMTTPGNWAFSNTVSATGTGAVSHAVSGLLPNTQYFYRYSASDANLTAWAPSSAGFILTEVSVIVPEPVASEDCPLPATFRIVRPTPGAEPLVVNYTVAGTATADSDYTALTGTATIPAGATSVDVSVFPLDDIEAGEGRESVQLSLVPGPFIMGAASNAVVFVEDDDAVPDALPGLQLWLRADAGTESSPGVGANHGDTVTVWNDQSPNGLTVDTTASAFPSFIDVPGEHPVVFFDVDEDFTLADQEGLNPGIDQTVIICMIHDCSGPVLEKGAGTDGWSLSDSDYRISTADTGSFNE